jgi:hypothetical protein
MNGDYLQRRLRAARRWRGFAAVVPASLLLGLMLHGTLSDALDWERLLQPVFMAVMLEIFALIILRRSWFRPWVFRKDPDEATRAKVIRNGYRFMAMAWAFSASQALLGLLLMLAGGPSIYAYFLFGMGAAYLALYYPRVTVFTSLLRDYTERPERSASPFLETIDVTAESSSGDEDGPSESTLDEPDLGKPKSPPE